MSLADKLKRKLGMDKEDEVKSMITGGIGTISSQYANQAQGTIGGLLSANPIQASDYYNQQIQQQMMVQKMMQAYPGEITKTKYRTHTLRVEEITNGFLLHHGEDKFYCADLKEVGDRTIACLVVKEIMK